ncbi:hypothetical protein C1645_742573 [Glomus cerebriforme]|uniref:Phosphatidylglycerol/phosphatidylinositol transfer protein n=1 Tax=Glomus cerebriforme TaxID=658196 RepID=A0A397SMR4_9GLOM|nr:hypothetical protein C1645_742573 [Glomus cerebriforme]
MNRNFIFAFILLATLSMVNAIPLQKRAAQFLPCPISPAPDLLSVKINPDPPIAGKSESFTISGKLHEDITPATLLAIAFGDVSNPPNPLEPPFVMPACGGKGELSCPVKAGTSFTIKVDSVPVPAFLPPVYGIGVAIGVPTGNPKDPITAFGCAYTIISNSGATGPSPDSYPIASLVTDTLDAHPTI